MTSTHSKYVGQPIHFVTHRDVLASTEMVCRGASIIDIETVYLENSEGRRAGEPDIVLLVASMPWDDLRQHAQHDPEGKTLNTWHWIGDCAL